MQSVRGRRGQRGKSGVRAGWAFGYSKELDFIFRALGRGRIVSDSILNRPLRLQCGGGLWAGDSRSCDPARSEAGLGGVGKSEWRWRGQKWWQSGGLFGVGPERLAEKRREAAPRDGQCETEETVG